MCAKDRTQLLNPFQQSPRSSRDANFSRERKTSLGLWAKTFALVLRENNWLLSAACLISQPMQPRKLIDSFLLSLCTLRVVNARHSALTTLKRASFFLLAQQQEVGSFRCCVALITQIEASEESSAIKTREPLCSSRTQVWSCD